LEELADVALLCVTFTSLGPAVPASISNSIDQLATAQSGLMEFPMPALPEALIRDVAQARTRTQAATISPARAYFLKGTDLLRGGRHAEAESCFREALRFNNEDADVLNNLGNVVWHQGRSPEALAYFLRAYQFKPNDFGILNNLGIILWEQNRPEKAIEFYRRALQIKPDAFDTKMNLGVSLSDIGLFDEALVWLRGSVRQDPKSADAWDNVGMTLARQGNWDEAMKHYDEAIRLRPDFGEARRNRALGWLAHGDLARGFPESEWRLMCRNPPGLRFPRPRWGGEPLDGRTILLHYEQGLGDTLQFIRFAPQVKERGGKVWVLCQPSMVRLLSLCPSVEFVTGPTAALPEFDVHAPLMSVPSILGTTLATLPEAPYLFADTASLEQWRPLLQQALGTTNLQSVFKIGIAWQGSPSNHIDRWRSFPLAHFSRLAQLPGIRLISLQKGPGTEQIAKLAEPFPITVLDDVFEGGQARRDFLDTAAIMSLLDLVITPETAVAHLAGSMGIRAWIALSHVGDWRWMTGGETCPWYANARLFRQPSLGDWDHVFRTMEHCLAQELRAKTA
jgi:tetratricopeptide (TPR) repeat protein